MSKLKFGDYCTIEQYRYGGPNERYLHKVIGTLKSNAYVTVPVRYGIDATGTEEVQHYEMADVVRCICCGVMETEVLKFRIKDVVRKTP